MNAIRLLIVAILAVATTTAAAIELRVVRRNRTRPCLSNGIPAAAYQYEDRSESVSAISQIALLDSDPLDQSGITSFGENVRRSEKTMIKSVRTISKGQETLANTTEESTVQLERLPAPLSVFDEITDRKTHLFQWDQETFAIDHCSVSVPALRLSSNGDWVLSLRADQNPKSATNEYNPTLYIKRNQFVIKVRCYGNFQTLPTDVGAMVGRPILAELPVSEFWVENGQPKYVRLSGNSELVGKNFELIDRVEFQFFYRK